MAVNGKIAKGTWVEYEGQYGKVIREYWMDGKTFFGYLLKPQNGPHNFIAEHDACTVLTDKEAFVLGLKGER